MSEENAAVGTEGAPEGAEGQETPQHVPMDEFIQIAKAAGWKEDGPLDAKDFLKGIGGRFHDQTRTMKELKKSVDGITKHFSDTVERQVQERLATLESERDKAILAGDVNTVKQIDKQIRETEKTEIPKENAIRPEVQEFLERNPWFDKDKRMTRRTVAYKDEYLEDNPNASLQDALDYAESEIKKAFPDKFATEEPRRKPAGAAVESPASQGGSTATWQQMKSKMTSFEKDAMADILKQTHNGKPVTTEKAYIESLIAVGAFEGRK